LHPESLADGRLIIQDPDANGESIYFFFLLEKTVTAQLRDVEEIARGLAPEGDDPLTGDIYVGLPGEIEVVQGTVIAGQFPETQVILPGNLIEVFIADDMMALEFSHHSDGLRIHPGALGEAVSERPHGPGGRDDPKYAKEQPCCQNSRKC
jgi:hypothetical protein